MNDHDKNLSLISYHPTGSKGEIGKKVSKQKRYQSVSHENLKKVKVYAGLVKFIVHS